MKKAVGLGVLGTLASWVLIHFLLSFNDWALDLYYAFAFGLGLGFAYYVDDPNYSLNKKLGLSLLGIALLVALGFLFFDGERAIPSVIRFSLVFVGYYMLASLQSNKSLRN